MIINLYELENIKEYILTNVGNQTVLVIIDFPLDHKKQNTGTQKRKSYTKYLFLNTLLSVRSWVNMCDYNSKST